MLLSHSRALAFCNATSDNLRLYILRYTVGYSLTSLVTFLWMTCGIMRLATLQFERKLQKCIRIGIAILERHIIGYTFGNHVLWLRSRVAVKLHFRPYIRRSYPPNENFEYSYHLNIATGNRYCTVYCILYIRKFLRGFYFRE